MKLEAFGKREMAYGAGEKGAALVVALLVMVICALLGATSILTSNTDIQIAVNERVYHEALMNADAGVQWLRTQNLDDMSSFTLSQKRSTNSSVQSAGAARGIRFAIPTLEDHGVDGWPVFLWLDQSPDGGGARVYRVLSRGTDRNGRGVVTIEAEIRMAPAAGEVDQGGNMTTYP
jgi:hypothetical protein